MESTTPDRVKEALMERALTLARRARGSTSPNPPVGAIIVKHERVVGEGLTQPPGGSHAEIMALGMANSEALGATMYVTLEPCAHWGRTAPCADAVIRAGIREVHVAVVDPNPKVNGQGIRRLQEAGIAVSVGIGKNEAAELIEGHESYITRGRPFVTTLYKVNNSVEAHFTAFADAIITDDPSLVIPDGKLHRVDDPTSLELDQVLEGLTGHGVAYCLIHGSDLLARVALSSGLVDKVVSNESDLQLPGFASPYLKEHFSPHTFLYAVASGSIKPPCSPE